MQHKTQINCPHCGTSIDVQDILAQQLEGEIKKKYQLELSKDRKQFEAQQNELQKEREEFERKKKQENQLFQERLEKQLKEELNRQEVLTRQKIEDEQREKVMVLQKELLEKSGKLQDFYKTLAELEKLKREKDELKFVIEAEAEKKLNKQLELEKEKWKRAEAEKSEMQIRELQKQLDDQKKLTEEMKRKQDQGSIQLQGEVQELAIEEWLMAQFPLDHIEEIKKGARGGDCIQIVNTRIRQNCGKIYYESKRTKEFQHSWVEKLKNDMRDKGADIGVIVTEVMPQGTERMTLFEGIWICTFHEFKGLCSVLRESIIQLSTAISAQENKGDKMHMLYDYLTSTTFRMQVEAIVEGFSSMKNALDSEKRSMQRIWKEREKQIDKVITNTIDMYASVKGIAGNAIQPVKSLELPFTPESDEDDDGV